MLGRRMMAMCRTLIASETPKGREILRNCAVGLDRAGDVGEQGLQRVVEHAGDLQREVEKLVRHLSMPAQFAEEERASSYTYPSEYSGPKPITEQIGFLAKILGLDPTGALEFAKNLPVPPDGAEGWFAIPSVDALAKKHFPEVTDPAQMYCQSVQLVHARIAASRLFYNYREGQITPAQLRLSDRTAQALGQIAEVQKGGDILIVGAQLGLRHRGRSVRWAREVFVGSEFGLGSLAVGSIVLTHPDRLTRWEQLQIDCAGDEFVGAGGRSFAPYFFFGGGEVGFGTCWVGCPYERYGSASGFLPQCLDA